MSRIRCSATTSRVPATDGSSPPSTATDGSLPRGGPNPSASGDTLDCVRRMAGEVNGVNLPRFRGTVLSLGSMRILAFPASTGE